MELSGLMIIIMISAALLCFLVSEITLNYSQVDKLWSIMPVIYGIITLVNFPGPRVWLMTIMVTLWGFRLSYNFSRKGGYNIIPWKGEEDYRWSYMRQTLLLKGRFRFGLFNFLFISFYQQFLIFLFSSPLLLAAKYNDSGLNWLDISAAAVMIVFLLTETIADNQQYYFQSMKKNAGRIEGKYEISLKNGFLSEGLWRYSRHPNFASEQAIWAGFYLFGVAASGQWINWTIAGSVLLILLFAGSTQLTEKISSGKYRKYADYRKNVSRFIPFKFRIWQE